MATEDFYGGPQTYDPAMGLMLVRNPEIAAQLLAQRGVTPPADIEGSPDHVDAGQSLGRALTQYAANLTPSDADNPQGLPRVRLPPDQPPQPPAPPPAPPGPLPAPQAQGGGGGGFWNWLTGGGGSTGAVAATPPPPMTGPPMAGARSEAATRTPEYPALSEGGGGGGGGGGPTPAPEAAAATGAAPAGDTSKKPGGLDSLAQALAGLKVNPYQNPLHIYSPQAPHPSNMIARSTVPQTLMQEIAGISHPAATFRLGEALKGRSAA